MTLDELSALRGVDLRNALTRVTDRAVLEHFALDPRVLIASKAAARLRALDAETDGPAPGAAGGRPAPRVATAPEPVRTARRQNVPTTDAEHRAAVAIAREQSADLQPTTVAPDPRPPLTGSTVKTCTRPGCGATGTIDDLFGWRTVPSRGGTAKIPQPQCKPCRNAAARKAGRR